LNYTRLRAVRFGSASQQDVPRTQHIVHLRLVNPQRNLKNFNLIRRLGVSWLECSKGKKIHGAGHKRSP